MANVTPEQWASALLQRLRIPETPGAVRAVVGWERAEGGHWHNSARFNPLNTTQPAAGAGNTGTQGNIKVYKNWDQGLHATVQTLRNGRYGNILKALQAGNPGAVGSAIAQSPWGTGGLAAKTIAATPSPGKLPSSGRFPSASAGSKGGGTRTIPGQDRSGERQSLLLNYLLGNSGGDLLNTVTKISQLKDTPAKRVKVTQGMSKGGGGGGKVSTKGGVTTIDGKPVADWIAKRLERAKAAGWQGTVSSGYRSVAEQRRIYNSGVRPAAKPGQSNHNFTAFPGGAVDVTDAPQLAATLKKLGIKKLQWAGGKDPVHFSHPHNGGY